MVYLTDGVICGYGAAKVFQGGENKINAIDFYSDGSLLVTSSDDHQIVVYDCNTGREKKKIYSKKYGCDLAVFTHDRASILHGSTVGNDDSIRYLDFHTNTYKRYFRGHRDRVTNIEMSPKEDTFISSARDGTVRLWDLRSDKCQGALKAHGHCTATFDNEGLIFATGIGDNKIRLYDARAFDAGPFSTFDLSVHFSSNFQRIRFSPDGKMIIALADEGTVLMDSYSGLVNHHLRQYQNVTQVRLDCSFSPDSQYATVGSEDGNVLVYSTNTGRLTARWVAHAGPVCAVRWNPHSAVVASACSNLVLWLPNSA